MTATIENMDTSDLSSAPIFVLDNGGYTMKAGWSSDPSPLAIPNCITKVKSERRRPFIGDQMEDCKDYSGMFYILPVTKGYIVNWETQKNIWNYLFRSKFTLNDCTDTSILMTEPYFNFRSVDENLLEILFEEYKFKRVALVNPASLIEYKHRTQRNTNALASVVVDAGYSFTHIVPHVNGKQIKSSVVRIDVGGKALTNHLKDVISYRQLQVLDETYVMNQCKEDSCFVSQDLNSDLVECMKKNNSISREYVLPDYTQVKRGYLRNPNDIIPQDSQIIRMNNERIQIPELLFYPTDASIPQIGISHAIHYAIQCQPETIRPHMYQNIILSGGSSLFPGFKERVQSDIRSLADTNYDVQVSLVEEPIHEPWLGGKLLAQKESLYQSISVNKKFYDENGPLGCTDKFDSDFKIVKYTQPSALSP